VRQEDRRREKQKQIKGEVWIPKRRKLSGWGSGSDRKMCSILSLP
jgi:hypothetical protein